jgi:hypothetical protein
MRAAAPQPLGGIDEHALERRARRLGLSRAVTAVVTIAVLAGATYSVVGAIRTDVPGEIAGNRSRSSPYVPPGERHLVLSGTYGDDWDRREPGASWRLLAWAQDEGTTFCKQLFEGPGTPDDSGATCTHLTGENEPTDHIFGLSTQFETGSSDPDEFMFVVGDAGPQVARVRFQAEDGRALEFDVVDAPPEANVPFRYFAATLPRFSHARVLALSAEGETIAAQELCGPGCDNEMLEERRAIVAEYEAQPIEDSARAAAFANLALGDAGLVEQFATWYRYEDIVDNGDGTFVASFDVFSCEPPPYERGERVCDEESLRAAVTVSGGGESFEVVDADGPMSSEQRERLMSYEPDGSFDDPMWVPVAATAAPDDGGDSHQWLVSFGVVWTGNLPRPSPGYGAMCWVTVTDADGDEVYRGMDVPAEVGIEESDRMMVPTTEIDHDIKEGDRVDVTCDPPSYDFYR